MTLRIEFYKKCWHFLEQQIWISNENSVWPADKNILVSFPIRWTKNRIKFAYFSFKTNIQAANMHFNKFFIMIKICFWNSENKKFFETIK